MHSGSGGGHRRTLQQVSRCDTYVYYSHTSNVIVCISQLRELLSTELGDEELMKV